MIIYFVQQTPALIARQTGPPRITVHAVEVAGWGSRGGGACGVGSRNALLGSLGFAGKRHSLRQLSGRERAFQAERDSQGGAPPGAALRRVSP